MYNFCFYIYSLTITIEISYIRSNQFIKLILLVGLEMYAKRGHMHPLNNRRGINYFASDWKCLLRGDQIKKKWAVVRVLWFFLYFCCFQKWCLFFFCQSAKSNLSVIRGFVWIRTSVVAYPGIIKHKQRSFVHLILIFKS